MSILTQNKSKVTVADPSGLCSGDWFRHSGVGGNQSSQKVRAVAGGPKLVLPGEYEASDVTTVRYVDPERDGALVQALVDGNPLSGTTLTVIDLDGDGQAIGSPITLSGCAVTSWSLSDGDANADAPQELSVVWSVGSR